MADEPLTVRGISWRQTFPFINLFRAFRVAVHPSKLVLALVALALLYLGGHTLDLLWPMQHRAIANEAALYEQFAAYAQPGQKFSDVRKKYRDQVEAQYAQQLLQLHIENNAEAADKAARNGSDLGLLKNKIIQNRDQAVRDAAAVHKAAMMVSSAPMFAPR